MARADLEWIVSSVCPRCGAVCVPTLRDSGRGSHVGNRTESRRGRASVAAQVGSSLLCVWTETSVTWDAASVHAPAAGAGGASAVEALQVAGILAPKGATPHLPVGIFPMVWQLFTAATPAVEDSCDAVLVSSAARVPCQ